MSSPGNPSKSTSTGPESGSNRPTIALLPSRGNSDIDELFCLEMSLAVSAELMGVATSIGVGFGLGYVGCGIGGWISMALSE
jgi:hypothetical protein